MLFKGKYSAKIPGRKNYEQQEDAEGSGSQDAAETMEDMIQQLSPSVREILKEKPKPRKLFELNKKYQHFEEQFPNEFNREVKEYQQEQKKDTIEQFNNIRQYKAELEAVIQLRKQKEKLLRYKMEVLESIISYKYTDQNAGQNNLLKIDDDEQNQLINDDMVIDLKQELRQDTQELHTKNEEILEQKLYRGTLDLIYKRLFVKNEAIYQDIQILKGNLEKVDTVSTSIGLEVKKMDGDQRKVVFEQNNQQSNYRKKEQIRVEILENQKNLLSQNQEGLLDNLKSVKQIRNKIDEVQQQNTEEIRKLEKIKAENDKRVLAKEQTKDLIEQLEYFDQISQIFLKGNPEKYFNQNYELQEDWLSDSQDENPMTPSSRANQLNFGDRKSISNSNQSSFSKANFKQFGGAAAMLLQNTALSQFSQKSNHDSQSQLLSVEKSQNSVDQLYALNQFNAFYQKHNYEIPQLFNDMGAMFRYYENNCGTLSEQIVEMEMKKIKFHEVIQELDQELLNQRQYHSKYHMNQEGGLDDSINSEQDLVFFNILKQSNFDQHIYGYRQEMQQAEFETSRNDGNEFDLGQEGEQLRKQSENMYGQTFGLKRYERLFLKMIIGLKSTIKRYKGLFELIWKVTGLSRSELLMYFEKINKFSKEEEENERIMRSLTSLNIHLYDHLQYIKNHKFNILKFEKLQGENILDISRRIFQEIFPARIHKLYDQIEKMIKKYYIFKTFCTGKTILELFNQLQKYLLHYIQKREHQFQASVPQHILAGNNIQQERTKLINQLDFQTLEFIKFNLFLQLLEDTHQQYGLTLKQMIDLIKEVLGSMNNNFKSLVTQLKIDKSILQKQKLPIANLRTDTNPMYRGRESISLAIKKLENKLGIRYITLDPDDQSQVIVSKSPQKDVKQVQFTKPQYKRLMEVNKQLFSKDLFFAPPVSVLKNQKTVFKYQELDYGGDQDETENRDEEKNTTILRQQIRYNSFNRNSRSLDQQDEQSTSQIFRNSNSPTTSPRSARIDKQYQNLAQTNQLTDHEYLELKDITHYRTQFIEFKQRLIFQEQKEKEQQIYSQSALKQSLPEFQNKQETTKTNNHQQDRQNNSKRNTTNNSHINQNLNSQSKEKIDNPSLVKKIEIPQQNPLNKIVPGPMYNFSSRSASPIRNQQIML